MKGKGKGSDTAEPDRGEQREKERVACCTEPSGDTTWRECNERRWGARIRGAAKGEKGAGGSGGGGATATAVLP